jgi:hypothetical protein
MKKLTYLVSAVVAGLFTSAHADVSVSGSASVVYQSAGSDTNLHNGGAVSFGLSTTTASGMTVSTSAGITNSTTSGSAGAVTGWDNLTFATGGVTLTVGNDIGLPDGVGEVGGLVGDTAAVGSAGITSTTGLTDDEGAGISLSTSLGSAGLSLYYVADSLNEDGSVAFRGDIDGATGTGSGVKVTTSVGDVGLTVAYVTHQDTDVDDTETAAAASYATGMGTISVGYTTSTGTNDGNSVGVAYSMDLDADTSLGIGYQSHDVNSNSGRATDVTISRSLGGGMSVFGELRSTSGDTDDGENSTMAIGTSVSF